ncbi:MAG: GGDEF-domain containing protein, partial [Campylobacter concisus]|nr:GGDEF-domain containing protein [Campylobacter concisus]
MLDRITNFHNGSFLFIFALIIAYFFAIYLGDQFYLTALSVGTDVVIAIFLFFLLKSSRNLNSYWTYIFLAIASWALADILLLLYDRSLLMQGNVSRTELMQILYLIPFFMFIVSFVAFFTRILKRVIWQQVAVDALALMFITVSFFWFVVFDKSLVVALNQEFVTSLSYIIMDIFIFCFVFVVAFSLNFVSKKPVFSYKRVSLLLYLLALLIICICDAYYSSKAFLSYGGTNVHYEFFFKVAFFIIFVACLHLKENEANIKIRSYRKDY